MIAPFSLATSLAMVGNAADQQLKSELLQLFDMEDGGIDALNQMFKKIYSEMPELDPQSQLNFANSVWTDIDGGVPNWYVDNMSTCFNSPVTVLDDIESPQSTEKINKWINSATNGLLDFKADYSSSVDEEIDRKHLVAINAMYFKGQWREKFKKEETENRKFYNADGTTSTPMTMRSGVKAYIDGCYLGGYGKWMGTVARLPYGNNSFALSLFLPVENVTFDEFVQFLANGGWDTYSKQEYYYSKADVQLPRFEINSSVNFNKILLDNGVDLFRDNGFGKGTVKFFDCDNQFSVFTDQQTLIKVDEDGSEAVAVTHTHAGTGVTAPMPDQITFDRPFVFVLSERSTGAILVAGCVNQL